MCRVVSIRRLLDAGRLAWHLAPDELRLLRARCTRIAVTALLERGGVAPPVDSQKLDEGLRQSGMLKSELQALEGPQRAREVEALAIRGIMPPVDSIQMANALQAALSPGELQALYHSDLQTGRAKLDAKGVAVPMGSTPAQVDVVCTSGK